MFFTMLYLYIRIYGLWPEIKFYYYIIIIYYCYYKQNKLHHFYVKRQVI